jgi:hypothetical protein
VHHQHAGAPGYRRDYARELQVEARRIDGCLIRAGRRLRSGGTCNVSVVLLMRDEPLIEERFVARGLLLRVGVLRHVFFEHRLRLYKRELKRPGVDFEQHLTLRHVLPFGEVKRGELSRDLRPNLHGRDRFSRSDRSDVERHSLLDDDGRGNRYGRSAVGPAAACRITRGLRIAFV